MSRKPIQYKVKKKHLIKKPVVKAISTKERIKQVAKLWLEKSRVLSKKTGVWLKRLIKNRRFFISLAIITTVVLSFFAGMGMQSYLSFKADIMPRVARTPNPRMKLRVTTTIPQSVNDSSTQGSTSQSNNPTLSANVVANGIITVLTSTEIAIKDNTGTEHKFNITKDTDFVSIDAKVIQINEVKVGYAAMVYGVRDGGGNVNLARLKVTAIK